MINFCLSKVGVTTNIETSGNLIINISDANKLGIDIVDQAEANRGDESSTNKGVTDLAKVGRADKLGIDSAKADRAEKSSIRITNSVKADREVKSGIRIIDLAEINKVDKPDIGIAAEYL